MDFVFSFCQVDACRWTLEEILSLDLESLVPGVSALVFLSNTYSFMLIDLTKELNSTVEQNILSVLHKD